MKFNNVSEGLKQEVMNLLNDSEDKSAAIYEAVQKITEVQNSELINQIVGESARAAHDEAYRKNLNLAKLSKEEEQFYESFKDIKQAITANQIDILPTTIIDRTLDSVKKNSDILSLVQFAPADVKKWIVAERSGTAVWGSITDKIVGELSATITAMNVEQHKLSLFLVIPKAISELALPFVDKYFTAILQEGMQDGLVKGYLNGDGKSGPIGIMNKIAQFKEDGTATAKEVLTNITKFSPKGLAEVRKILTNNGERAITELHLICNPLDEAEYVDPAMFGEALTGGYRNTSFMTIVKHADANVEKGKAIFTIKDVYVVGATSVQIKEYNEVKALDDADVVIGKCNANGRAVDDNCAVVFDVTKLEEYVLPVSQATQQAAGK